MPTAVFRVDLVDMTLFILIISAGFLLLSPLVFSAFFRAKEEHIDRLARKLQTFKVKGTDDGEGS